MVESLVSQGIIIIFYYYCYCANFYERLKILKSKLHFLMSGNIVTMLNKKDIV